MDFDEFQSMILEEVDIKDELILNADEQEEDEDPQPQPTNHPSDQKLNRYVECRVFEEMEISPSDKEFQRDSYDKDNVGVEPETSFNFNQDARVEFCGVYRKLKLLVDILKNCKQREKCGICEKYIQQLQQHILLTHGNDQDAVKGSAIASDVCGSVPLPAALDQINTSVKEEGINLDIPRDHHLENVNVNNPGVNVRDTDVSSEIETETSSKVLKNQIRMKMKSKKKGSEKKISKSKPYKCETCGEGFLTFFDLTEHQMTHNIKKTNAAIARSNNASHLNKYRPSAGSRKQELKHDVSNMRIPPPRIVRLNNHILTHTGEKAKHELIHTEVKSRMCNLCGKGFVNHSNLTLHILRHTGEKPFKCDVCGRCFVDRANLRSHKFTHTVEKPNKCDVCGKSFARPGLLTRHKLTHTGEKPHKCDVCGKGFGQFYYLSTHKIIHTGEKPHKCDVCGKGFARHYRLAKHMLAHTREKVLKCNV